MILSIGFIASRINYYILFLLIQALLGTFNHLQRSGQGLSKTSFYFLILEEGGI
jgi:hypothetical protein